jgi:hypothetical protein
LLRPPHASRAKDELRAQGKKCFTILTIEMDPVFAGRVADGKEHVPDKIVKDISR